VLFFLYSFCPWLQFYYGMWPALWDALSIALCLPVCLSVMCLEFTQYQRGIEASDLV